MPSELSEDDLKAAYSKVLACTKIGAAETDLDKVFTQNVLHAIPQEMQKDYPARILLCAIKICTKEPFFWTVIEQEPVIDTEDTFKTMYEKWFVQSVY